MWGGPGKPMGVPVRDVGALAEVGSLGAVVATAATPPVAVFFSMGGAGPTDRLWSDKSWIGQERYEEVDEEFTLSFDRERQ